MRIIIMRIIYFYSIHKGLAMINPSLGFVLLFVENPIKSAEFYGKIFDSKPVELSPTFALFALKNHVMLGLWSYQTAEPKPTGKPGASEIAFAHEQVDALYAEWEKLGISMAQVPTDMDFGRTFVALDPDGHRIRIYKLHEQN